MRHLDWDWIEIPESCYGVREKAGVYGMTKKGNQYFPGEKLAYFKDDRADKKETDEELEALTAKIIPYDESNKHNGPIHWEKHKNKIDKYRNAFIAGVRHSQAKRLHDPPQNPNKEEMKQHAIQFAEWASEDEWEYWEGAWHKTIPVVRMGDDCFDMLTYSSEQLYNQFINRK